MLFAVASLLLACGADDTARRYYEEAQQWQEQGDAPRALECLRRAANHATSDTMQVAIYGNMGRLLFDEGLEEQSLAAFLLAFDADQQIGDSVGMAYDLRDIANVYRTREDDDSCLYFFNEALLLARSQGDSLLVADIGSQIAGYYLWHRQYDEACQWLLPALKATSLSSSAPAVPSGSPAEASDNGLLFMAADLYRHTGHTDSARYYCQQLLTTGNTGQRQMAHRWLAELLLEEGRTTEAAWHLVQYEQLTDTLMQETDTETMRRVNALYDYTQHEQENAFLQRRIVVALSAIVVLVCLLVTVTLIFSRRRMAYRLKVQQLEHLLDEQQRRDTAIVERQRQILADTPICQHIARLLGDARQLPMTDEDWHILEDTIEKTHPGFQKHLLSFRKLSTQELHICWLIKAGISPIGIAQLTSRSKQSVSSTRSRLYEKVFGQKGSPAQWDAFIQSL